MRKILTALINILLLASSSWSQANLSVHWEDLTAEDFSKGILQSQGTCLVAFGILEKHGPHLALGTDLINVRYVTLHAAEREYAIVFPEYYFGQIFEAKHEPGTIAYSAQLQLDLLQETTDEMARNGCKKVIIVNGHGGNDKLLPFFAQSQLQKPHDYAVYILGEVNPPPGGPAKKSTIINWHAGEDETSDTMISRPDLVHLDRAAGESGADQKRLDMPNDLFTAIGWYVRFPNHYSGEGAVATHDLGEYDMKAWTDSIVKAIKAVKADHEGLKLKDEFYEKSKHPLETQP